MDGSLSQVAFINTNGHGNVTGIAFDGMNFFVSDIFNNQISVWDGTTGAFINNIVFQGSQGSVEDLSVDFAGRADTCGQPSQSPCENRNVPEPDSLALLAIGLVGFGAMRCKQHA